MSDPLATSWKPEQVTVMESLRAWAVGFVELNQHMSAWMDLPTSDANALGQIVWAAQSGEPLSPVYLARRIGMSSGAVTALLNRLEAARLVERSREHEDRRRVTLRPTTAAVDRAREFALASSTEIFDALHDLSPEDLAAAARVLARMTAAANAANGRLEDAGARPNAG